jgi:hypothetical protein
MKSCPWTLPKIPPLKPETLGSLLCSQDRAEIAASRFERITRTRSEVAAEEEGEGAGGGEERFHRDAVEDAVEEALPFELLVLEAALGEVRLCACVRVCV